MEDWQTEHKEPRGKLINIEGEAFYHIAHVDQMPPFLMTLVSPFDHWMFISSRGGLTAGREHADNALFPYYTEDKLHELSGKNGPATQFWLKQDNEWVYWAPFNNQLDPYQKVQRHLFKHVHGHEVIFEEYHEKLGLLFRYSWQVSERFGFIRKASLLNKGTQTFSLWAMDGLRQILPAGVRSRMQTSLSNLLTAYKKTEWYDEFALYRLSATPIDRAEPSEALLSNIAWSVGSKAGYTSLGDKDWERFAGRQELIDQKEWKGQNGAFLLTNRITLEPGVEKAWWIVADVHYDASSVIDLRHYNSVHDPIKALQAETAWTGQRIRYLLGITDGLQAIGDKPAEFRHASNVMFNDMRGGVVFGGPTCPIEDLKAYLVAGNAQVAERNRIWINELPDRIPLAELRDAVLTTGDTDLIRLVTEYMPLGFSRRHGDPSRPWNTFHIQLKDEQGYNRLYYEGNWRDIFQNWEALSYSYPELLPAIVAKFWNASTIDGYNPYRITKDGVDWEVLEPNDDWSYVGYWGDHQLIYQTKLLERWQAVYPGEWKDWLLKSWFVFPDVPYHIRDDQSIFENASDTIDFDEDIHSAALARAKVVGFDGKNIPEEEGSWIKVNGLEKLLITISAKLDNLIPGVGIWMNTQRPEWNDANNALVGRGASTVTACHLYRHLQFLKQHLAENSDGVVPVHETISDHWLELCNALRGYRSNGQPLEYLCSSMKAGSKYRTQAYNRELGEQTELSWQDIHEGIALSLSILEDTVLNNKRPDNLFNAYHLVQTDGQDLKTTPLYLMLEGQVAVLEAGLLSTEEVNSLLKALRASDLYEPRQNSYLLYPDRELPLFMERNTIPAIKIENSEWFGEILSDPTQQIFTRDRHKKYHFQYDMVNERLLINQIERYRDLTSWSAESEQSLLDLYEDQFHHSAFTGRSGTFYAYEGLGSIYWHMVSKLVLSVQNEMKRLGIDLKSEDGMQLRAKYEELRHGLGWHKSPDVYGAIPLDPYSHTPKNQGVKQPGMTGQVKEDIIARYGDLGIHVANGAVYFTPEWVPNSWWVKDYNWWNISQESQVSRIKLAPDSLGFTYAGVFVVYYRKELPEVEEDLEIVQYTVHERLSWAAFKALEGKSVICISVND